MIPVPGVSRIQDGTDIMNGGSRTASSPPTRLKSMADPGCKPVEIQNQRHGDNHRQVLVESTLESIWLIDDNWFEGLLPSKVFKVK